jgi:putative ABC transport system ATP-binding protein
MNARNDDSQSKWATEVSHTATSASTAVLEASGLTKVYGSAAGAAHKALDDFDLQVPQGEFLGVMGPSGSGKSTLLNLLATNDTPTAGHVRIDGEDPAGMNPGQLALFRRRKLGFVFQEFNLLDTLTVRENILLPLVLDRVPVQEMNRRLGKVTSRLGIGELMGRRTYEISGGQQQRVAIARAIITEPSVVLADELTGNLDSRSAQDVMATLQSLNEDGVTVVMVTHDPYAASYCRRIVFIKDGRRFSEMTSGGNRQTFFQQVLDSLSVMGGVRGDVPATRA